MNLHVPTEAENKDNLSEQEIFPMKANGIESVLQVETTDQTDKSLAHIRTLPVEIKVEIFGYLKPVSSACLGVTCKSLYDYHRANHGIVKLSIDNQGHSTAYKKNSTLLANFLLNWVPEELRFYNWKCGVFVTKERFADLIEEWISAEMPRFWKEVVVCFPGLDEAEYEAVTRRYANRLRSSGMIYESEVPIQPGYYTSYRLREKSQMWGMQRYRYG